MKRTVTAFVSGLLFGSGLVLAGMTTPANILAFLDVAGDWSPAMALVMGSAIAVAAPAFWLARRRQGVTQDPSVVLSRRRPVDRDLVIGSLVFGVGWGLSGICPGPGLVLASAGSGGGLVFVLAMALGMWLSPRLLRDPPAASAADAPADAPAGADRCG